MVICFIGHRTVSDAEQVLQRLLDAVSSLIEQGADTFLFGSRSKFDFLSWEAVTQLKEEHPNLKRVNYSAPHETVYTSKEEREESEEFFSKMMKREVHFKDFEENVPSQKSLNANKNTYIMRNQEMIDHSDVCVFYYDKNYLPPKKKRAKRFVVADQPKSGTAIAFAYATQKKKQILNLY